MNKLRTIFKHPQLVFIFAAIIFCIDCISVLIISCGVLLLSYFGLINGDIMPLVPLPLFVVACLILGTVLAAFLSNIPLGPINKIIDATDKIADGDYSTRIDLKGPKDLRVLSQKFNHMTQELSSVEMLRSDFVNNFSHEFKTPIASIQGFAQVLLDRDVPPEEQKEYLTIIVKESKRLADLATNVLNLSKIEQMTILTEKKSCNISEQIRTTIMALDLKWSQKQVGFQLDSENADEIYAIGNEELLKQVWMNLLDNAIKFSPQGGLVKVTARQNINGATVLISNQGDPLPPEAESHIFDRFYQSDTSHTTEGNGLGLTIAKKIAELHKGGIYLEHSANNWITFRVEIPNNNIEDSLAV